MDDNNWLEQSDIQEALIWTSDGSIKTLLCLACYQDKGTKVPSVDPQPRATYVGEVIHCDLGEINPTSVENNKYYDLKPDDPSRHCAFNTYKSKDLVTESLLSYVCIIQEGINGHTPPKRLQTVQVTGAKDFLRQLIALTDYCNKEKIQTVISTSHNRYEKSVAECGIGFVQTAARATGIHTKTPMCFWDCTLSFTYETISRTAGPASPR
ncbi:uncharacterized protein BCR38DRAFT_487004 [Pseudomassariella vexata]|uniref:Uncharacterized protein n=1 Tax=Pseudomassariella vexata TaxID=1141098 RepID=A0A1Y2DQ18_9PEZI|nr:uncharacterized protein BCR38DRAFT_487004 [Pseudomassariella vexata]ORY61244.1 hypothetical protein BCR38DRAFT_487004 [Pseudomassariella vexata]